MPGRSMGNRGNRRKGRSMEQKMRRDDHDWITDGGPRNDFHMVCEHWARTHIDLPDGYKGPLWIILSKTRINESWEIRTLGDTSENGAEMSVEGQLGIVPSYAAFWELVHEFNGDKPTYLSFEYGVTP